MLLAARPRAGVPQAPRSSLGSARAQIAPRLHARSASSGKGAGARRPQQAKKSGAPKSGTRITRDYLKDRQSESDIEQQPNPLEEHLARQQTAKLMDLDIPSAVVRSAFVFH